MSKKGRKKKVKVKVRITLLSWLAVMLFVPLALSSQTTQSEQAGQPQTELPLVNPVSSTLTGTFIAATTVPDPNDPNAVISVPAACQFSLSLPPNLQVVEARRTSDITVDDASNTCSAAFDVGQPQVEASPSPAESTNIANTSNASSSDITTQTGSFSPDLGVATRTVTSAGLLKTWYIDPLSITVNSVQDSTKWNWSGTGHCVKGLIGGFNLTWFGPSGWFKISSTFQNTYNCTETTVGSTALFDNPVFCALNSTFATYNNKVHGMQNGVLVGTWNDSIFGSACTALLRFRVHLQRTQN